MDPKGNGHSQLFELLEKSKSLNQKININNANYTDKSKQVPVIPVANKPRCLVMGNKSVTLV